MGWHQDRIIIGALALAAAACGGSIGEGDGDASETGGTATGGAATGGDGAGGRPAGGTSAGGTDAGGSPSGGSPATGGSADGGSLSGGAGAGGSGGTTAGGTGGRAAGGTGTGGLDTGGGSTGAGAGFGGSPSGGAGASGGSQVGGAATGGAAPGGTGGAGGVVAITEDQLDDCERGEACIIVAYSHCCGATKRAINERYEAEYAAHAEWHVFDDPVACALIGACPDDRDVVDAYCYAPDGGAGTCQMLWPDQCPVPDCNLACPFGYWQGADGCETCACAPPPLTLEPRGPFGLDVVTFTALFERYIGGIDRTTFAFTWQLDDPASDDEELTVAARVVLAHLTTPYFGAETTYLFPAVSPIESAQVTRQGAGGDPVDYTVVGGYLSVRVFGEELEGGVYLEVASDIGNPSSMVLGGTFSEPNPWPSLSQ